MENTPLPEQLIPLSEAVSTETVAQTGTWLQDLSNDSVVLNKSWYRMMGVAESVLDASQPPLLAGLDEEEKRRFEIERRALIDGSIDAVSIILNLDLNGKQHRILRRARLERDQAGRPANLIGCDISVQDEAHLDAEVTRAQHLLRATRQLMAQFVASEDKRSAYRAALKSILDLSGSEYGFITEAHEDGAGRPYLVTKAMTDISWSEETQAIFRKGTDEGIAFTNLKSLFGSVLTTGEAVISDDPSTDPRSGGLPEGHPPLLKYLGIPLYYGGRLVGEVGLANRDGGYDQALLDFLEPFTNAVAQALYSEKVIAEHAITVSELEETGRYLSAAVAAVNSPISIWDNENKLVHYNALFKTMTLAPDFGGDPIGMTHQDYIQNHLRHHIDFQALGQDPDQWLGERKKTGLDVATLEVPLTTGEWLLLTRHKAAGVGTVSVSTDITALKERVQDLRKARQVADDARHKAMLASSAKDRFLAHMSHELRTPLNAILGFSEIMKTEACGPIGSDQYRSYAQDIYDSGQLLLSLVEDVLNMSRIEARQVDLKLEPLFIEDLVARVLMLARRPDDPHQVSTAGLQPGHEMVVDSRSMLQILLNLVSNALKFTPEDKAISIGSSRVADGGHLIWVRDEGIGMSVEEIRRAMKPFGQTSGYEALNHKGVGLGLPIAAGLVEAHGGTLSIESEMGLGTTVSVLIPELRRN